MFTLLTQFSNLFTLVHEVLGATCTDFFFVFDPGENLAALLWKFYQSNHELFVTVNAIEILAQVSTESRQDGQSDLQSLIPGVVS